MTKRVDAAAHALSGENQVLYVRLSVLPLPCRGILCRNGVMLVMVEKRTDTPEKPTVVSKTEARQATTVRGMLPVLVISTVGAIIVLAGLYIYYFGLPF